MTFKQRLPYFLSGLVIGIILLFFFLGGKKTSCAYGPEARVIKNINIKERIVSEKIIERLRSKGLDTSHLGAILRKGDVIFSESNTSLDSCKQYVLEGLVNNVNLKIRLENCETQARILSLD